MHACCWVGYVGAFFFLPNVLIGWLVSLEAEPVKYLLANCLTCSPACSSVVFLSIWQSNRNFLTHFCSLTKFSPFGTGSCCLQIGVLCFETTFILDCLFMEIVQVDVPGGSYEGRILLFFFNCVVLV